MNGLENLKNKKIYLSISKAGSPQLASEIKSILSNAGAKIVQHEESVYMESKMDDCDCLFVILPIQDVFKIGKGQYSQIVYFTKLIACQNAFQGIYLCNGMDVFSFELLKEIPNGNWQTDFAQVFKGEKKFTLQQHGTKTKNKKQLFLLLMKKYASLLALSIGMMLSISVCAQDDGPEKHSKTELTINHSSPADIAVLHVYNDNDLEFIKHYATVEEAYTPTKARFYYVPAVIGEEHTKATWPVSIRYRCRSNC